VVCPPAFIAPTKSTSQIYVRHTSSRRSPRRGAAAALALGVIVVAHAAEGGKAVDFKTEIRPLLESKCFECHGPQKQKNGLRLDLRGAAFKGGEDLGPAIVPHDADASPLIRKATDADPQKRMPLKGEPLTPDQLALLRAWINQGAPWPEKEAEKSGEAHWAFAPVTRPSPPRTAAHPIDAFIRARLSSSGLTPSPEADRVTLIRRLYGVMLGMPPTPADVTAFLADHRRDAFERLVDRVLDDPRYGERWARHWLDVVRFAESNGFETNRERQNGWRYRDYVIEALNHDKPYDRFVREQIAGDALGADVATGFLVAGPTDIVKSPDAALTAQQRADELDDMVGTTGTAFLGLTLGCARCHAHKFDPIPQTEYYALSAVFSGVQHGERALPAAPDQKTRLATIDALIREREVRLARYLPSAPRASELLPPVSPELNEERFEPVDAKAVRFTIRATTGAEPCIDELEAWAGDKNVALASNGGRPSASGTLAGFDIHRLEHLNDGRTGNGRSWISNEDGKGWARIDFASTARIDRIVWGRDREGRFKDRLATDYVIEALEPSGQWRTVAGATRRRPYGDSKPAPPAYVFDGLPESEARQGRAWLAELEAARKERERAAAPAMAYAGTFSEPPVTHRLHRGDAMQPKEPVPPGGLSLFAPWTLDPKAPEKERRLKLAEWLTDERNPLTARVIVNRVWQHHFGVGLVDTPNDFGRAGSKPSHPELLDWLASELMHPDAAPGTPWALKRIHRLILTSATWRQSDHPVAAAMKKDAGNRLLWRFMPRRLEAEAIRDGILAVAGDLDPKAGGPGFYLHNVDRENVYHYHPKETIGPAESRRMIYAVKVRMEQDAIFGSFDAPDGSLVTPKRSVSTTPLQALNLFNSRFVLDEADHFAGRLQAEAGGSLAAQVHLAWKLAFGRPPKRDEAADAVEFAKTEGMRELCRSLFNANEFLFLP
jgi:mono/diheme cytochrome c family protein